MATIDKRIFKKHYTQEDFKVNEKVRIYITPSGKRHTERETREGIVLETGIENGFVMSKNPSLKLCVYKTGRFVGKELEADDKRYVGKYLYSNIKFVEHLGREKPTN